MRAIPPDPINRLCSFPDSQISENHFTYPSVQIFKIMCGGFDAPGSDPLHKISGTVFVAHPGWLFHFYPTKIVWRNCFVPVMYQLPKSTLARLAIKSFCILDRVGQFGRVATVWVLRTWYIVFFETVL